MGHDSLTGKQREDGSHQSRQQIKMERLAAVNVQPIKLPTIGATRELLTLVGRQRVPMIGSETEQSLIEACRAGQTEAFGVLVQRYQDRLYPTMLRLTGSTEDALDLLQDAFLRAFEKLGSFHGESSFYTWVYRIAVNLALSGRRRHRSVRVVGLQRGEVVIDPPGDSASTDPTLPLERSERDTLIQSALNSLAEDHRAVVVMKEFDGLRYEEIAVTLGVPVGTVRSRLHRARLELRDRLQALVATEVATSSPPPLANLTLPIVVNPGNSPRHEAHIPLALTPPNAP